jgi:hypothetical protein
LQARGSALTSLDTSAQASLALGGLGITAVVASVVGSFVLMDGIGRVKTMHIGSFFCSLGMIFL